MDKKIEQNPSQPPAKTSSEGDCQEMVIFNWRENQNVQMITTQREKNRQIINRFRRQLHKLIPAFLCSDPERGYLLFKLFCDIAYISNINNIRSVDHIITENRVLNALNSLCSIKRGSILSNNTSLTRYRDQFEEICKIGSGGYGNVFRARHVLDQMDYAVKKIRIKCSSTKQLERTLAEVKTLAKLEHANIVTYKQAWMEVIPEGDISSQCSSSSSSWDDSDDISDKSTVASENEGTQKLILYIQMSLCAKNLRNWMDERNDFSPLTTINGIGTQILSGLDYIHKSKVIHHDLNPYNIFISTRAEDIQVQIGDFGLACCPPKAAHSTELGTRIYAAPEQLKKLCSFKSDIYSFGIILFELLLPMKTMYELLEKVQELKKGFIPNVLEINYRRWVRIVHRSISEDPLLRLPASAILKSLKTDDNLKITLLKRSISNLKKENVNLQNENKRKDEIIEKLLAENMDLQAQNNVKDDEIAMLNGKLWKSRNWYPKRCTSGNVRVWRVNIR